jgi:uncharacterized membrane protein
MIRAGLFKTVLALVYIGVKIYLGVKSKDLAEEIKPR